MVVVCICWWWMTRKISFVYTLGNQFSLSSPVSLSIIVISICKKTFRIFICVWVGFYCFVSTRFHGWCAFLQWNAPFSIIPTILSAFLIKQPEKCRIPPTNILKNCVINFLNKAEVVAHVMAMAKPSARTHRISYLVAIQMNFINFIFTKFSH